MTSRAEHYKKAQELLAISEQPGYGDSTNRLVHQAIGHATLACVSDKVAEEIEEDDPTADFDDAYWRTDQFMKTGRIYAGRVTIHERDQQRAAWLDGAEPRVIAGHVFIGETDDSCLVDIGGDKACGRPLSAHSWRRLRHMETGE